MSEFFQRRRVYRWLREIVVLLVLAAVLMWGVDRFRSPTLPDRPWMDKTSTWPRLATRDHC